MPTVLALVGPFAAAAVAAVARRRVGVWASWLLLMAIGWLYARFGIENRELWWHEPTFGFLSGLNEAMGIFAAAITMALVLHSFGRSRPSLVTLIAVVGFTGVIVQWALAGAARVSSSVFDIAFELYLLVLGMWLFGLLLRDFTHWRRMRRTELGPVREA